MAVGRRRALVGSPNPRRAGSTGGPRPGAATAGGPARSARSQARTRASRPSRGRPAASRCAPSRTPGISSRRSGVDVLLLMAGR